jgi:hypothetical protein
MAWSVFFWLGVGKVAGCCEQDNEIWDSIKYGELFDWPKNY